MSPCSQPIRAVQLGEPRLVVQVKSEAGQVGLPVVRQLQGAMAAHGVVGLLVAWGGITRQACQYLSTQRFAIKVWNSDNLLAHVFEHYAALPADLLERTFRSSRCGPWWKRPPDHPGGVTRVADPGKDTRMSTHHSDDMVIAGTIRLDDLVTGLARAGAVFHSEPTSSTPWPGRHTCSIPTCKSASRSDPTRPCVSSWTCCCTGQTSAGRRSSRSST
ncbi:restriction endonuclease [Actinosynnema sp. CS-041913]|uniref:restriction endonuclease n=1 Tax=Actinosynnema sp. CS-041913 TaxID=3239917 RepID=UPI003D92196A